MNNKDQLLRIPTHSTEAFRAGIAKTPLLTHEQEVDLGQRIKNDNDEDAARELVLCNLRFVAKFAYSYRGYGLPDSDLIQEGIAGLIKAVKKYDPELGYRFITFAIHYIRAEVNQYVYVNVRQCKMGATKAKRKVFSNLRRLREGMQGIHSLSPDEAQAIADELEVPVEIVTEMERFFYDSELSYESDAAMRSSGDGEPLMISDTLGDDRFEPGALFESEHDSSVATNTLFHAIDKLDERLQLIIKERWLTDNKSTLEELAARIGVSAERVRQLEKSALQKLRGHLEAAA